jgi:hypothetical protein
MGMHESNDFSLWNQNITEILASMVKAREQNI